MSKRAEVTALSVNKHVSVVLGKYTYSIEFDAHPDQVGGRLRYVVISGGHPVMRRGPLGAFWVAYGEKRAARATAKNLTQAGLPCEVYAKQAVSGA